jgi:hypothetical protein
MPIVLHLEGDFKNFKVFGDKFKDVHHINIIDHYKNSTYSILKLIKVKFKFDIINVDEFKKKNNNLYDILPLWMKTFFGYKSLMNFIYDPLTE